MLLRLRVLLVPHAFPACPFWLFEDVVSVVLGALGGAATCAWRVLASLANVLPVVEVRCGWWLSWPAGTPCAGRAFAVVAVDVALFREPTYVGVLGEEA